MQLGPSVRATESSSDFLQLVATPPPPELAANAEIFVVSGYEPARGSGRDTSVRVLVDRPGSKVLLVLTSYDKVLWKVDATPTTTITGIVVAGYHEQAVATRVPTRGWRANLPYATDTDNSNFLKILSGLHRMFGVEHIDAFRGSYAIPADVAIRTVDARRPELTLAGPLPVPPRRSVQFTLMTNNFVPIRWSLTGPLDKEVRTYSAEGKVAVSLSLQQQFRLGRDQLESADLRGGQAAPVTALPPNFPVFSWPMDVAYDTRRDLVAVVSLGGEGFLYRFDAKSRRWVDFRSMRNIDVIALSYDKELDRYVGWTSDGALIFIDMENGNVMSRRVVNRLTTFGRLYDRGNERPPRLTIVPSGDDIMLIQIAMGQVQRIWHYNVKDDSMEFTYSADQ